MNCEYGDQSDENPAFGGHRGGIVAVASTIHLLGGQVVKVDMSVQQTVEWLEAADPCFKLSPQTGHPSSGV